MNTVKDLVLVIKSHFPLVCVETNEETRLLRVIENACNLENWSGFTWTIADGVRRMNGTGGIPETAEFRQALRHIDKTPQNGVYVLLDAHPYLVDPVNVRLIKEIAQEYARTARTLVFVSRSLELPHELQRMAARFTLPLPERGRIHEMIKAEAQRCEQEGAAVCEDTRTRSKRSSIISPACAKTTRSASFDRRSATTARSRTKTSRARCA